MAHLLDCAACGGPNGGRLYAKGDDLGEYAQLTLQGWAKKAGVLGKIWWPILEASVSLFAKQAKRIGVSTPCIAVVRS